MDKFGHSTDINGIVSRHVETVVLLRGGKVDGHVEIDLDVDKPGRKSGTATYAEIKAYIEDKYGFKGIHVVYRTNEGQSRYGEEKELQSGIRRG